MKKLFHLITITLLSSFAFAQDWSFLDQNGVYNDTIGEVELFVDDGIPYVVINKQNEGYSISVKKYENDQWVNVGASLIADSAFSPDLYVDNGIPYITYHQRGNVFVKKYINNIWEDVGSSSLTTENSSFPKIFVDNNIPYVALTDSEYSNKLSVLKFVNNNWEFVGNRGISQYSFGLSYDLIVSNGVVYVVEIGSAYSSQVLKFETNNWENVGSIGITPIGSAYHNLAIDENGNLYLIYKNAGLFNKCSVKVFDGNSWEYVGSQGISSGEANFESIFIHNNQIFIAFTDFTNEYKAKVMTFIDGNWVEYGNSQISYGYTWYTDIAVSEDGVYVSYMDKGLFERALVQYAPLVSDLSIEEEVNLGMYPNPVQDFLIIENIESIHVIRVINIHGSEVLSSLDAKIYMGNLDPGIYFVEANYKDGNKSSVKVIKY